MSSSNPRNITIKPGFDRRELPALFCWQQRIWDSINDGSVPKDLDEWMNYQDIRLSGGMETWGVYRHDEITGYVEATSTMPNTISVGLESIAECGAVFKKEFWGLKNTVPAMNLFLADLFTSVESAFFSILSKNKGMAELLRAIGCSRIGITAAALQNALPVDTELWAITATQWERDNAEFLAKLNDKAETVGATT